MRKLSITVTEAMAGRKVKSILRREFSMPEGLIARVKLRETGITLNGARCRAIDTVRPGDVLTAEVGDESAPSPFKPVNYPLDIPYEDEDIIIINKPAGMASHGAGEKGDCTVASALAHHLGGAAFHPVSRLDRGTSGLMLVAKSGYIHDRLRRQLHSENYIREYLLVCSSAPAERSGSIVLPIAREEGHPFKRRVSPDGAPSRTDYEILRTEGGMSLCRARLHTGRTHQIRLHFAALGCPLAGDWLYGEESPLISRPALHSAYMELTQPLTGERIVLSAPLPADMAALGKSFESTARKAFRKEDQND